MTLVDIHSARIEAPGPVEDWAAGPTAEDWTFQFLGAALAHHLDEPDDLAAPREGRD